MPLERDLRAGFERIGNEIEPAVDARLDSVRTIARRRRTIKLVALTAVAAAVVGGVAIGGPRALDALRAPRSVAPAGPSRPADPYRRIAGSYETTVARSGGAVASYRLAGRWVMTLRADGTLDVKAPVAFERAVGTSLDESYSLSGRVLQTSALRHDAYGCGAPGVYRWQLRGSVLRFSTLQDGCPYRPAVFSSDPWRRVPNR